MVYGGVQVDASYGFEMETFEFLNLLQVYPWDADEGRAWDADGGPGHEGG